MASVAEITAGVRAALATAASVRRRLLAAVGPLELAGRSFGQLGAGSTQPELPAAATHALLAAASVRRAVAALDNAVDAATAYLAAIAGTTAPRIDSDPAPRAEPPPEAPVTPEPPGTPTGHRQQLDDVHVDRLRRQLPPPIPASESGGGRKTHGRWVGADGVVRSIVSQQDAMSRAVEDRLRSFGYRPLWISTHVETRLAEHLRQEYERTGQLQHATVVLNNRPCEGPYSCETLLPVLLPEGCTLTVHAPDSRLVYTGGVGT